VCGRGRVWLCVRVLSVGRHGRGCGHSLIGASMGQSAQLHVVKLSVEDAKAKAEEANAKAEEAKASAMEAKEQVSIMDTFISFLTRYATAARRRHSPPPPRRGGHAPAASKPR
jgi:hypothetical protein